MASLVREYAFPWCNNQAVPEILLHMSDNTLQVINTATMRSEKFLRGHRCVLDHAHIVADVTDVALAQQ
jgi:hypothetical protein